MANKSIEQLRQAELWASVADALLIAAEDEKRVAIDRLATTRLELQLAEEMKRGEA